MKVQDKVYMRFEDVLINLVGLKNEFFTLPSDVVREILFKAIMDLFIVLKSVEHSSINEDCFLFKGGKNG